VLKIYAAYIQQSSRRYESTGIHFFFIDNNAMQDQLVLYIYTPICIHNIHLPETVMSTVPYISRRSLRRPKAQSQAPVSDVEASLIAT
jgi:hypothetical protein